MSLALKENLRNLTSRFFRMEERHPYETSFVLSLCLLASIFWMGNTNILVSDTPPPETITLLNIEEIQSAPRTVKKQITESEEKIETEQEDRAKGISDDQTVDLAFYPNVAPPRLISRLNKRYPTEAKLLEIEATVYAELEISKEGRVTGIRVINVQLTKDLPAEKKSEIIQEFAKEVKRMLQAARFSPPVVNGQNVGIRLEQAIRFRLEE